MMEKIFLGFVLFWSAIALGTALYSAYQIWRIHKEEKALEKELEEISPKPHESLSPLDKMLFMKDLKYISPELHAIVSRESEKKNRGHR